MHLKLEGNSGRQDIITWTKSGQDIINVLYSHKKISEGLLVKDISWFERKVRQRKTCDQLVLCHKHDPGTVI